jgi:DNA-binding GntR family transcriptional regulator
MVPPPTPAPKAQPSAGTRHLKRQGLPQALAASLRQRILDGEFADGAPLAQEALAAEYDVSRMPVREALRELEAEGFVKIIMHRGAFVAGLSPGEISELFDLRAVLEPNLLRHALTRANPEDFAAARAALARLETAYRKRDVERWGELNWAFHERLYAPANRLQTLDIVRLINQRTERYVRLHLLMTKAFATAEREHADLLELCMAGERARAQRALRAHVLSAKAALLEALGAERVEGD